MSMTFSESLAQALEGASQVILVGIGNELNGDDGFGVRAAEDIGTYGMVKSIMAHTVPENFINRIAAEKPTHVIFADAAILDAPPGTLQLIDFSDMACMRTMTHRIPLAKIIERLLSLHECKVLIVGVQPKSMEVGAPLSEEVSKAVKDLADILRSNLS